MTIIKIENQSLEDKNKLLNLKVDKKKKIKAIITIVYKIAQIDNIIDKVHKDIHINLINIKIKNLSIFNTVRN